MHKRAKHHGRLKQNWSSGDYLKIAFSYPRIPPALLTILLRYPVNGGVEADVRHRVKEGCKVLGTLKGVMKNRGLGMNVKKALYEKVVVPTVMYGSESWGMKVTERQKLNVFEVKCLRSMTGVSRLDRVRNEVVRVRTGVRRELAARVDMNVLRWFGHVERMDNERLLKKCNDCKS